MTNSSSSVSSVSSVVVYEYAYSSNAVDRSEMPSNYAMSTFLYSNGQKHFYPSVHEMPEKKAELVYEVLASSEFAFSNVEGKVVMARHNEKIQLFTVVFGEEFDVLRYFVNNNSCYFERKIKNIPISDYEQLMICVHVALHKAGLFEPGCRITPKDLNSRYISRASEFVIVVAQILSKFVRHAMVKNMSMITQAIEYHDNWCAENLSLYIPQTFVENEVFGLFDKYFNNHKTFNKIFGTLGDEWRSHGFVDHIKGFVYFNGKQICVRDNESIAFLAPNETFKIMSYGKLFMEGSSPEFGFVDIELFVNFYTYSQEHLELYMKTGMENKPEINYASPNIHNDDTCCGIFPFDD